VESELSPSPVEFSSHHHFYKLSCSWLLGMCFCSCKPACLFTADMGSGSSPIFYGVFLPLPLSQAFPLLVAGCVLPLPPSLARSGLFIYSSRRDSPPPFRAQGTSPSLLRVFIVLIAYYSVSLFSPGGGSVCLGGYAVLTQGCLWKYHVPLSSPCGPHLPKPSRLRHLAAAQGATWFLCSM
jgi:hypothetical protein